MATTLHDLVPEQSAARELLGTVLETSGRRDDALRVFATVSPTLKDATDWFHQGRLHLLLGEVPAGLRCLERALQIDAALRARILGVLPPEAR